MKQIISIFVVFVLLSACRQKHAGRNFLFDMGPENVAVADGYTRVGPRSLYDTSKGFGWIGQPSEAFDTANAKLHSQVLRSGISAKDSLVFKADIPAGEYFVIVTVGNKDSIAMKMTVSVNGQMIGDTLQAQWYRLAYRTLRRKIDIESAQTEITVKGIGTGVGIYGIEFRPIASPVKINFESVLEQDTAAVMRFRDQLQHDHEKGSSDIDVVNQLDIANKYLLACSYFNGGGWSWASRQTGFSLIYRMYAAADLLEQVTADPGDPLYEKAMYLLARIYYWLDKEDNNSGHELEALRLFGKLAEKHPDDQIIRMYLGEKILNENISSATDLHAPLWARYQHESMQQMLDVIHWWVTKKQADNGEIGGKWGDDVEILRWWLPAVLGADDSLARLGYMRLADGVWNSGILERGFAKRIDDVEHAAELFRDTHPGMFLVNYGDPEYVERSLISMQNFRDVWTGITANGHRHFKSYYLSGSAVLPQYPFGVDVALNARAVLPGLWAAWYTNNSELIKLFNEWCRSWIEDAARASNGKPAGVLPSAVGFNGDRIGGDSKEWYEPGLTYEYYDWDHLGHVNELQYHLLGMYRITGDKVFLQTVNFYRKLMSEKRNDTINTFNPGSLDWVRMQLLKGGKDRDSVQHPMGKLLGMAKQLTNTSDYDSLLSEYGHPFNRYTLSKDTAIVIKGLERILGTLRYNFPLLTSEVKFTDRVYIPGVNLLMGMYTGHFGAGYEFPALLASWKNTGNDVAVFVQTGDRQNLKVSLYNFGKEKTIGLRTWQLHTGLYKVILGTDTNSDGVMDEEIYTKEVRLTDSVNDIELLTPSGKNLLLIVEPVEIIAAAVSPRPDLAIHSRDVRIAKLKDGFEVSAIVHNIGNAAAREINVIMTIDGKAVDSLTVRQLDAPNDLDPRMVKLVFTPRQIKKGQQFQLEVKSKQAELTMLNNNIKSVIVDTGAIGELSISL
ncbi:hypothetical protein LZZ85_16350 [Terrimonas sp. NA20]|uniref:CARDB domain-containing protein n=1 Tax=Terrimonas ginsenosidimutans TaxID=2908004 RepID=A0ABS9KUA9_9BACT|nr:CARDB domain-containing protein [Terrimonas ginsenosidimutans]MCG2615868.1 hypothetical protein [Terrimonas ginsenosidimutans]